MAGVVANMIAAYLEADVRRNERKMGGFTSWEIFGTGFKILIFLEFSRDVQVSKFWIFPQFPAIFRVPKKASNIFFHGAAPAATAGAAGAAAAAAAKVVTWPVSAVLALVSVTFS